MTKKLHRPPPLSFDALKQVEEIERYTEQAMHRCTKGGFNKAKALTILRTCITEAFNAKHNFYISLSDYRKEWISEIKRETIDSAICFLNPILSLKDDVKSEIYKELQRTLGEQQKNKASTPQKIDRKKLHDSYLANFPDEKIKNIDICWAVGQHYSEWKRWIKNDARARDGLTADLAFRKILMSGKRPSEFRKQGRPDKWE